MSSAPRPNGHGRPVSAWWNTSEHGSLKPRTPYEDADTSPFFIDNEGGFVHFCTEFKHLGSVVTPCPTSDADVATSALSRHRQPPERSGTAPSPTGTSASRSWPGLRRPGPHHPAVLGLEDSPARCGDFVSLTGDGGRGAGGYRRHRPEPLTAEVQLPPTARRRPSGKGQSGP